MYLEGVMPLLILEDFLLLVLLLVQSQLKLVKELHKTLYLIRTFSLHVNFCRKF